MRKNAAKSSNLANMNIVGYCKLQKIIETETSARWHTYAEVPYTPAAIQAALVAHNLDWSFVYFAGGRETWAQAAAHKRLAIKC